MTDQRDDRDVRARFHAWREAEATTAPSFASVLARRGSRHTVRWRWPALAVAAAVLVVAGVWRRATVTPRFEFTVGELRTPTDFLLDMAMPGAKAGEIPQIGTLNWYPLPAADAPGGNIDPRRGQL